MRHSVLISPFLHDSWLGDVSPGGGATGGGGGGSLVWRQGEGGVPVTKPESGSSGLYCALIVILVLTHNSNPSQANLTSSRLHQSQRLGGGQQGARRPRSAYQHYH